jgi:hypothetical protein
MAIRKPTKKSTNPAASNPAGKNAMKISSSVTVLGKALLPGLSPSMTPRQPFTNAEMARLGKLADRIKAMEVKAANDKKANAKIIKEQNKKKSLRPSGPTKPVTASTIGAKNKPVVKVKPPKGGRGGGMGGAIGGGGLFGGRGLGQTK